MAPYANANEEGMFKRTVDIPIMGMLTAIEEGSEEDRSSQGSPPPPPLAPISSSLPFSTPVCRKRVAPSSSPCSHRIPPCSPPPPLSSWSFSSLSAPSPTPLLSFSSPPSLSVSSSSRQRPREGPQVHDQPPDETPDPVVFE